MKGPSKIDKELINGNNLQDKGSRNWNNRNRPLNEGIKAFSGYLSRIEAGLR